MDKAQYPLRIFMRRIVDQAARGTNRRVSTVGLVKGGHMLMGRTRAYSTRP
jgi:hypothetical protein